MYSAAMYRQRARYSLDTCGLWRHPEISLWHISQEHIWPVQVSGCIPAWRIDLTIRGWFDVI